MRNQEDKSNLQGVIMNPCNLSTGRLVQKGRSEARLGHNNETLPPNSKKKVKAYKRQAEEAVRSEPLT